MLEKRLFPAINVNRTVFYPVTSQVKGYPFEVRVPEGLAIRGSVLSDQVKSLDWRVRKARRIAEAPQELVAEVLAKAMTLFAILD